MFYIYILFFQYVYLLIEGTSLFSLTLNLHFFLKEDVWGYVLYLYRMFEAKLFI